jgi:hypothetical protein
VFEEFLPKMREKFRAPGRYAVRRGNSSVIDFFKVSIPKYGQYNGAWLVKTQHGPTYLDALVVWPDWHWRFRREPIQYFRPYVRQVMLDGLPDVLGAALLYAEEKQVCVRCGHDLTDDESRWYLIGPECEQIWTDFKMRQIMTKGFFEHSEVEL